ncbi:type III-A CRISPR-associated protein Csm2 [Lachnospiraceae bacterium 46-61]
MTINTENYVDEAEKVINSLEKKIIKNGEEQLLLTTSKIRNILSMVNDIYNDTLHYKEDKIDSELKGRVQYLRMRIAYEMGRDDEVKIANKKVKPVEDFAKKAKLIENIKSIGDSKQNLILFCRYMEALVAYHKYYGGRD